jgi:hypothetical protein
MTDEQALSINLEKENNIETLKELIKYWQEKSFLAEYQLLLLRGNLSKEQIIASLNIERINEIMKKK